MTNCSRKVWMKEMQTSRDYAEQRAEVVISRRARPVHPVVTLHAWPGQQTVETELWPQA